MSETVLATHFHFSGYCYYHFRVLCQSSAHRCQVAFKLYHICCIVLLKVNSFVCKAHFMCKILMYVVCDNAWGPEVCMLPLIITPSEIGYERKED